MSDIPHPAETADQPPRGFAVAVRERHFARVAVEGPMGAGVTPLAIQWAKAIAGDNPVAVIDTEHRRAAGYAPLPGQAPNQDPLQPPWEFWHHPWVGSFDPVALVRRAEIAAEAVGEGGVLVIDSLSPFWSGRGGVQDIVDNSPSGWKVGAPVHRDMLDALSRLPCHLIVTMHSKTEWVIEEKDVNGRLMHHARRVGMAPDQRLGIDFEFELILTVDSEQRMSSTSSMTDFNVTSIDRVNTGRCALAYAAWISDGLVRISRADVTRILDQFDLVEVGPERNAMKLEFVELFGPPDEILAEHAPDAIEWVTNRVQTWLAPPAPSAPVEPEPAAPEPEQPTLPADPEDVVADTGDALADKTKDELRGIAAGLGVEVDGRWGAGKIAEAIRETMEAEATEES